MALRYWLIVVALGCIFGASFPGVTFALRETGPLNVGAIRSLVAALACWAYVLAARRPVPTDPAVIGKLLALGVFSYAFGNVFVPIAQQHISSGLAAIFNVLMPVFTVVVTHYWPGGEAATPNKVLGVVVGFGGAVLLFLPGLIDSGASGELWAMLVAMAPALLFAFVFNITRAFRGIDPASMAAIALTGAALVVVPVALAAEGVPLGLHPDTMLVLLLLGVFPSAMNFIVMYKLLPVIGPTNFSINTYVTPIPWAPCCSASASIPCSCLECWSFSADLS